MEDIQAVTKGYHDHTLAERATKLALFDRKLLCPCLSMPPFPATYLDLLAKLWHGVGAISGQGRLRPLSTSNAH